MAFKAMAVSVRREVHIAAQARLIQGGEWMRMLSHCAWQDAFRARGYFQYNYLSCSMTLVHLSFQTWCANLHALAPLQ